MKVKTDFVTNSSSTAYLLICKDQRKELETVEISLRQAHQKIIRQLDEDRGYLEIDECVSFKTIEEFQIWNNDGKPLDWVQKATGLKRPVLSRIMYQEGLELLEKGERIIYFVTDNSVDVNAIVSKLEYLKIITTEPH